MTGFDKRGDDFLHLLNDTIRRGEGAVDLGPTGPPEMPVVFVVGAPRSGTTVLMQWLASSGSFGVPTNLLARLYANPYIGGLLQRLVTDPELDYRGELAVQHHDAFASEVGKTSGLLAPHEFFYFWRQYLPLDVARPMTRDERGRANMAGLADGMRRLEAGLGRPLALKAIIAQYDIDLVSEAIPTAIFLRTRRDEVANVESILAARRTVSGSESAWFSVRPAGTERLSDSPPLDQAAAQVAWTNDDLDRQLALLDPARVVEVDHTAFCHDPASIYRALNDRMAKRGSQLLPYAGPDAFDEHLRASDRRSEVQDSLDRAREMSRAEREER